MIPFHRGDCHCVIGRYISWRGLTRVAYPGQGDARSQQRDRRTVEAPMSFSFVNSPFGCAGEQRDKNMDKSDITQKLPQPSKMEVINNFIIELSKQLFTSKNETTFYDFAKFCFDNYIKELKGLDRYVLEDLLIQSDEMTGNPTKKRFINLIQKIQEKCLCILEDYYRGDLHSALTNLDKLMRNCSTKNHLQEILANYFLLSSRMSNSVKLYRCVDWDLDKNSNDINCWHVPYNLRKIAKPSRFNYWGHICMYLSTSEDCANKEIGTCSDKKRRWTGVFTPFKDLLLMNLFFPTNRAELNKLNSYDKFCLLLNYPFFILCLTKSSKNEAEGEIMPEEYYFPQLFLHLIFLSEINNQSETGYPRFDGIIYNSMVVKSAANIAIPAKYDGSIPPASGHSSYIKALLKKIGNPYPTK